MKKKSRKFDWVIPRHTLYEFTPPRKKYCVCIPVINEGDRLRSELTDMRKYRIHTVADIIITDGGSNDGSTDHSFLKRNHVRTLLVKNDVGKLGAQLRIGYAYSLNQGYKGIITIDGNHKDSVTSIRFFIDKLEAGYDLVQGSRFISGGAAINTPLVRLLAMKLIHIPVISMISRFPYTDTTSGYRGYSRRYLLHPLVRPFRSIFSGYEILAYLSVRAQQLGLKVCEVPVIRTYPKKTKTPTKISWIGNLELLVILLKLLLGMYYP